MTPEKDYSTLTLAELVAAEKELKRKKMIAAALIGFAVGVATYGLVKKGLGFAYTLIPLVLIFLIYRGSKDTEQQLRQLRKEIAARSRT